MYLVHSLYSLVSALRSTQVSAHALAITLDLLSKPTPPLILSSKVLKLARKHSAQLSSSAEYWLARLATEKALSQSEDSVRDVWTLARAQVSGDDEGVRNVWTWGLDFAQVGLNSEEEEQMTDASWTETSVLFEVC